MNQLFVMGYIDPSVMTYAIQAGAGIVIAVGAFVGLYFHRAKKKVSKKLGIDENRKKEVESDEIISKKSTTKPGASSKSKTTKPKTTKSSPKQK